MASFYLIAFVGGAWLLQQQAFLPGLTGAAALVPLFVGWLLLRGRNAWPSVAARHAFAIAAFAATGFFWAAAVGQWKLADELPENREGRDADLSGVIAEMVQPNARGVRFQLDVGKVFTPDASVPRRISVTWYAGESSELPDLRAGQRWRMTVRLHRPRGNANPDGFDFEAWMLERGIRAVGYIRPDPAPRLEKDVVWRPAYAVERVREAFRRHLLSALGDRPYAGVIVALAVGDQQAIPPAQWQVFTRTGVNHLMSISGLHITMVASLVFLMVSRIWRLSEYLLLRLPAIRAATLAGAATALAYAALSGFAVPAQRTVYMLAIVAWALWTGWVARPTAILALAAAVVVCLDPMAVIAPGFWLSFGAVAVIVLSESALVGRRHWLAAWAQTQWAVTIALVPFLLATFQQVSLVSPLANAFAIPLVSFVVVPLALAASILPIDSLAAAAHFAMELCMAGLDALSAVPDAVWQQHAPPAWSVPVAVLGALWMLLPRGFPVRWAGAFLMLPLFLSIPERLPEDQFELVVLDVGQGLAVVVRTRDHALLYDTGPAFTEQVDAGSRIVVPYLRAAGVRTLDGLVLSHGDSDHSGGALAVLQAMPVGWMKSSIRQDHAIAVAAGRSSLCTAGDEWAWNGVRFAMLYPQGGQYNDRSKRVNDRSCVLKVSSPYGSVLLPGDIEKASEARLHADGTDLRADVLLAPHHGSRTSSTPDFVRAVSPQLTIFSMGYRNRFGHPHPLVGARYRQAGSKTLRSDLAGAIIVDAGPAGLQVRQWRDVERRYWSGR